MDQLDTASSHLEVLAASPPARPSDPTASAPASASATSGAVAAAAAPTGPSLAPEQLALILENIASGIRSATAGSAASASSHRGGEGGGGGGLATPPGAPWHGSPGPRAPLLFSASLPSRAVVAHQLQAATAPPTPGPATVEGGGGHAPPPAARWSPPLSPAPALERDLDFEPGLFHAPRGASLGAIQALLDRDDVRTVDLGGQTCRGDRCLKLRRPGICLRNGVVRSRGSRVCSVLQDGEEAGGGHRGGRGAAAAATVGPGVAAPGALGFGPAWVVGRALPAASTPSRPHPRRYHRQRPSWAAGCLGLRPQLTPRDE